jgi:hypothetical protein
MMGCTPSAPRGNVRIRFRSRPCRSTDELELQGLRKSDPARRIEVRLIRDTASLVS